MPEIERPRALVGWRLLAMAYDFFPVLALWFVAAGAFTAIHGDAVRGGWLGLLEFVVLWLLLPEPPQGNGMRSELIEEERPVVSSHSITAPSIRTPP